MPKKFCLLLCLLVAGYLPLLAQMSLEHTASPAPVEEDTFLDTVYKNATEFLFEKWYTGAKDYLFEKWYQDAKSYHTPLAGYPLDVQIAGEHLHIPAQDRRNVWAISGGTTLFAPRIGNSSFVPFAAVYGRQQSADDRRRFRGVISGVVNYLDFADGTWNDSGLEFVANWENFTVPFPSTEIANGKEVEDSELYWGHFLLGIGPGWRMPLFPWHCDNECIVQLFYEPGYFYVKRAGNSSAEMKLPPSTFIHQIHLHMRLDAFDRNIVELPHRGFSCGADIVFGRRDNWSDHRFSSEILFSREDTRDYLRLTAYMATAFGVPFVSERHRFLFSCHLGWSPPGNWDRFSALRLGGGPSPSESADLARSPYPGALFDQFVLERYALLTLEYRLELLFFMYAHVRGTLGWGRVAGLDFQERLAIFSEASQAFSVGLTIGFLWNSLIYVEYAYDNGVVRPNDHGHAVLISWSKSL
jgi:hypothetical protein